MKTTCRRYIIRPDKYGSWCEFLFFDDGLTVVHTFGTNGVFRWSDWGKGRFIDWILNIFEHGDRSYFLEKLFGVVCQEYQIEETETHVKKSILCRFREGELTKQQARKEYEYIDEYLYNGSDTPYEWLNHTKLHNANEYIVMDYPYGYYEVWDKFVPQLINEIKKDLTLEEQEN